MRRREQQVSSGDGAGRAGSSGEFKRRASAATAVAAAASIRATPRQRSAPVGAGCAYEPLIGDTKYHPYCSSDMGCYSDSPPSCCDALRSLQGRERCSIDRVLKCVDVIALLTVFVLQGSTLNYFLISRMEGSGSGWYFWFLADFAVLIVIMTGVFIARREQAHKRFQANQLGRSGVLQTSYHQQERPAVQQTQHHLQRESSTVSTATGTGRTASGYLGQFPLSYISWLFYSLLLTAKVVLLIRMDIATNIPNEAWYGSQFLTLVIGCAALVFALLVDAHHDAGIDSQQQTFITFVTAYSAMEILDAVTLLSLLFPGVPDRRHDTGLEDVILGLTCVNFLLPTFSIYKLAQCNFGATTRPLGTKLVYRLLHLVAVNGPYLAVRMYLWTQFNTDVSVFVLKNAIMCYVHVRSFVPECRQWLHELVEVRESLLPPHGHHHSHHEQNQRSFDGLPPPPPPANVAAPRPTSAEPPFVGDTAAAAAASAATPLGGAALSKPTSHSTTIELDEHHKKVVLP